MKIFCKHTKHGYTAFANMEINTTENNDVSFPIIVFMDSEKITGPFGEIETQPFLEQFWRETGADCDGEEGDMVRNTE